MKDIVGMKDGTILVNVHTVDQCAGQTCCVHNPSNHHMAQWPHHWDGVYKQMWRTCPHGLRHPDPDDLTYLRARYSDAEAACGFIHTCDGCCQPPALLNAPPEIQKQISDFLFDPQTGEHRQRREMPDATLVQHEGNWRPAMLRYNAAGDKKPGFECVHELENGMGLCGANVFTMDQAIGKHSCWVNNT